MITRNLIKELLWASQKKNSQNFKQFENWMLLTQELINAQNNQASTVLYSGTLNLDITTDQVVNMNTFGSDFMRVDIILFLPTVNITTAKAFQVWDGDNKTGNQYYTSAFTDGGDGLQNLLQSTWISFNDGDMIFGTYMESQKFLVPSNLYLSLGTAQGVPCTCSVIITGTKAL